MPLASAHTANWDGINKAIAEDNLVDAAKWVDAELQIAIKQKHHENWTRALSSSAMLRMSLNKTELAYGLLDTTPWPDDIASQVLLNLSKAQVLQRYMGDKRWAILNREQRVDESSLSLSEMTADQLVARINKAYAYSLKHIDALSAYNKEQLTPYIKFGNYPAHIRGQMRDTVVYLWVGFLENQIYWSVRDGQSDNLWPLTKQLASPIKALDLNAPDIPALHKLIYLLDEHQQWHLKNQRQEAALDAYFTRLNIIKKAATVSADKIHLREHLSQYLKKIPNTLPWKALGLSILADLYQADDSQPDALISAHKLLDQCISEYASSYPSKLCQQQRDLLETPSLTLESMKADGLYKRSIRLRYKNVKTVYFRAWRVDLDQRLLQQGNDRNLLPSADDIGTLVKQKDHEHAWQVNLPNNGDFKTHQTYVTPPMDQLGYWMIVSSIKEDFSLEQNIVDVVHLNLTQLYAQISRFDNQLEVSVKEGETGKTVNDASIEVWLHDFERPPKRVGFARLTEDGRAILPVHKNNRYFVLVKRDTDSTLIQNVYLHQYAENPNTSIKALMFSDRVLYRPNQPLMWKVLAYQEAGAAGHYKVKAKQKVEVQLLDANNQKVDSIQLETNEYGAVWGAFTLPNDRLFGSWSLVTLVNGQQVSSKIIDVAEYKRPAFKLAFDEAATQPMQLNEDIALTLKGQYYSGQPLIDARVNWRVERVGYYYPANHLRERLSMPLAGSPQVIASGEGRSDKQGQFMVRFKAQAEEREQARKHDLFHYYIKAEVVDLGGETLSIAKDFRLGQVGVRASIRNDKAFAQVGDDYLFHISRQDVNGQPLAGQGKWQLMRLKQPAKTHLPADLPITLTDEAKPFATQGDYLNPRWDSIMADDYSFARYSVDQVLSKGVTKHDKQGDAQVKLPTLPSGVYRFEYTTKDSKQQPYVVSQAFVVGSKTASQIRLPSYLQAERNEVEVGSDLTLLLGSDLKQQAMSLAIYHQDKLIKRMPLEPGIRLLSIPVVDAFRGGITLVLTGLSDYQILDQSLFVSVPWSDKALDVSLTTFRDHLQPGSKETWQVKVSSKNQQPLKMGDVQLLASMYDKRLDDLKPNTSALFEQLYPQFYSFNPLMASNLGRRLSIPGYYDGSSVTMLEQLIADQWHNYERPLSKGLMQPNMGGAVMATSSHKEAARSAVPVAMRATSAAPTEAQDNPQAMRSDFTETVFFKPDLLIDEQGKATFEFEAPQALTQWKLWVAALTKDMQVGYVEGITQTAKELTVSPYLPRFLRQDDRFDLAVAIKNQADKPLDGELVLSITDKVTGESVLPEWGIDAPKQTFKVLAKQQQVLHFPLQVNTRQDVVIAVKAVSQQGLADGEQHVLPVLSNRISMVQSRQAVLKSMAKAKLTLPLLQSTEESAHQDEEAQSHKKLVITLEGQLLVSLLNSLPYLTEHPDQTTEQVLQRFVSSATLLSLFKDHPITQEIAEQLRQRQQEATVDNKPDANKQALLRQTPWNYSHKALLDALDSDALNKRIPQALEKLTLLQKRDGGFPWMQGGESSFDITCYMLLGLGKAQDAGIVVPPSMVKAAFAYLAETYKKQQLQKTDNGNEQRALLMYVISTWPNMELIKDAFTLDEMQTLLDNTYQQWQTLPLLYRGYLALALHRADETEKSAEVFSSVIDRMQMNGSDNLLEDKNASQWRGRNTAVERHAFFLKALLELGPTHERRHDLVHWLMLNKKVNNWSSTRATVEAIDALAHYLKNEAQEESVNTVTANIGSREPQVFTLKPTINESKVQQVLSDIKTDDGNITLQNDGEGLVFASAALHYETDTLPHASDGDFLKIKRQFFKRHLNQGQWQLSAVNDTALSVGDLLEVKLTLDVAHDADYIHVHAPRGSTFEPLGQLSGYHWEQAQNAVFYREVGDKGQDYFFEHLAAGQYVLDYQVRVSAAGVSHWSPAQIQSVYAPEFSAYSSGFVSTSLNAKKP